MIMALDYNVSVTFINIIHPTSFDYGILLKVSEKMFLSNSNAYNDAMNEYNITMSSYQPKLHANIEDMEGHQG